MNSPPASPRELTPRTLTLAFFFAVGAFAWWRFSDNTADNDLWGHVLYGQRMLAVGRVETVDPFSWTALGATWINHEVLAEIALGWVHRAGGATGLWLLTIGVAAATVTFALREAQRENPEPGFALTTCALLAISANSLALGFSARPQLFTLLAFPLLISLLRRIHRGQRASLFVVPLLFFIWINTHGGVLAGLVITGVAAAITLTQAVASRFIPDRFFCNPPPGAGVRFTFAFLLAGLGMLLIPHGPEMLRWLIASVAYVRPEITEWRATPFDAAHATFFFVAALSIVAWCLSRRERRAWEAATLAVLLIMACRHQRHIPLFCLTNLILTPPHLLDLFRRLRPRIANLVHAFESAGVRLIVSLALLAAGGVALAKSVSSPRQYPWRIEVERDVFPCAALSFLRSHPIDGNLLVFFDWGQHALWELPRNPVSFDGRLDTIYSRAVIEAHWKFYRGEESAAQSSAPDLFSADIALLPTSSGGLHTLLTRGWTLVYTDPLASVLVREPKHYPSLGTLKLPVTGGLDAVQGREPFPDKPSALAKPVGIKGN